jgi:hypothetical protein
MGRFLAALPGLKVLDDEWHLRQIYVRAVVGKPAKIAALSPK